jgi:hypothetical protein
VQILEDHYLQAAPGRPQQAPQGIKTSVRRNCETMVRTAASPVDGREIAW